MNTKSYSNSIFRDIVILYCPEKVGSSTIVSSIRVSASDKYMVYHTHDNKIADLLDPDVNSINISDILKNNKIFNPITNQMRKIYLIDIYRTPIERKISYYFQKISEIHFNNSEQNISNYPIEKLFKRFNDIFPHIQEIDYYSEYYNCGQIDKFDFEKKYIIKEIDGIHYIKLRLEDSKYWSSILTEIFGEKIFITNDYVSVNKNIGMMYQKFIREYKLPMNYFNQIVLNSKLFHIYMREDEKKTYIDKWSKRLASEYIPFNDIEYKLYMMVSKENKFYCANSSNHHYLDDGCLCGVCKSLRKQAILNITNGNTQITPIKHPYDNLMDNNVYLLLFPSEYSQPIGKVVNLIN